MNIEEIKAAKEVHYEKAKRICRRYADNEIVYSRTFMEQIAGVFIDIRLKELHLLIEELTKLEKRINELDKYVEVSNEQ